MRSFNLYPIIFFILLVSGIDIFAAIPVAVIPFDSNGAAVKDTETAVKEILNGTNGLTVVADNMMADIMKIHENAQVLGSSYHDISKLKVAEFLVTGSVTDGRLNLKAVSVNEGTEVYNQTIDISGDNSGRLIKTAVKEMSDKILFQGALKNEGIPDEAKPYMELVNRLCASLSGPDTDSYRYIAVYFNGAYNHPDGENKKIADSAKLILKVMRQDLLRAKIYFIGMKGESFWVYIDVVTEKAAKKTKRRFGILELDDGSLGIGIYEEVR